MAKGVLLMAYGGPDNLEDVEPYYTDIRRGHKPTPELLEELIERYKTIGGKSPIKEITFAKARSLQEQLGKDYKVYVGMRHWHPYIKDTVAEMVEDGIEEAVGIVMAPHYSKMSIGKYIDAVNEAQEDQENQINFNFIESWHTHSMYIKAVEQKIVEALDQFSENEKDQLMVLFTAHSLPERIKEWNDPYPEQLLETSRILAKKLDLKNWQFAFQSAGRTPEPWLGPDILNAVEEASEKGFKNILVCSIGFIVDHLEVIYDIDIEAGQKAKELGVKLVRAKSLNNDPLLIEAFEDMVVKQCAFVK